VHPGKQETRPKINLVISYPGSADLRKLRQGTKGRGCEGSGVRGAWDMEEEQERDPWRMKGRRVCGGTPHNRK